MCIALTEDVHVLIYDFARFMQVFSLQALVGSYINTLRSSHMLLSFLVLSNSTLLFVFSHKCD